MSSDPQRLKSMPAPHVDLTTCDDEPIHIPGSIQPHGVLFALSEPGLLIEVVSENALAHLGKSAESLLNQPLAAAIGEAAAEAFRRTLAADETPYLASQRFTDEDDATETPCVIMPITTPAGNTRWTLIAHRCHKCLIVELEPVELEPVALESDERASIDTQNQLFFRMTQAILRLKRANDYDGFLHQTALEMKALSGFDRVMVYQFDAEGHGEVISEACEKHLSPYLGQRYPAADIPRQARALYLKNHLRLIVDVNYAPSPLLSLRTTPENDTPLDLSQSVLRSVSPIHIEYLQNMGVSATMVISLMKNGALWGLIACHHYSPRYVPLDIRTACENLSHFVMLELIARESHQEEQYRIRLKSMQTKFLEFMVRQNSLIDGLVDFQPNLGDFITANSCVISLDNELRSVGGNIPPVKFLNQLANWLIATHKNSPIYACNDLPKVFEAALPYKDHASGLLAIPLSSGWRDFIFWFRVETIQTVNWAGDPNDAIKVQQNGGRLTPRGSFELWKETVKLQSLRWSFFEQDAALELKQSIQGIMLQKTEVLAESKINLERMVIERTQQLQAVNEELEAFCHSVSHDLRAPLRGIDGFSMALQEDYASKLDETGLEFLTYIRTEVNRMGLLIDGLLKLSRLTRCDLLKQSVNLSVMVDELTTKFQRETPGRQAIFHIQPDVYANADGQLIYAVLQNLVENAWKFTSRRDISNLTFSQKREPNKPTVYSVTDNGAGFDMTYADKLFGVFQRLHSVQDFAGTGIGLATVKRIINRHGGSIWADSKINEGTTFSFTLEPDLSAINLIQAEV